MNTLRWIMLVLVLTVGLVAALFTIQNSSRVVDLSLDLWVVAFHLKEALPLPYLLWGAFGLGGLGGIALGIRSRAGVVVRMRELEQELARAGVRSSMDEGWP